MTHSLTLEQIKDLQQRGYSVTCKLAIKNNEPVEYLKVSQKLPITLKSLRKRVN